MCTTDDEFAPASALRQPHPEKQQQQMQMQSNVEDRLKALVAAMPGYARFKASLGALEAECRDHSCRDNHWVLYSISCVGDVTLFLLWSLGEDLITNHRSTREMFNLYTGRRRQDTKAYDHTVEFLRTCLKMDAANMFPTTLMLAVQRWLDPKADEEMLDVIDTCKASVLRMFARDEEFIGVMHKHMTYSLLAEEAQHIEPGLLSEARKLFQTWETSGDGLLGTDEARQALRHFQSHGDVVMAELFQDLLTNPTLWKNQEMEFAAFASAFARHKNQGAGAHTSGQSSVSEQEVRVDKPSGLLLGLTHSWHAQEVIPKQSPRRQSSLQLPLTPLPARLQQAVQLRSDLIRVIGAMQSFRQLILTAKKDVPDDALNVYNNAVFRKSGAGQRLWRYLNALGTLAVQLILPICIYLHAKEEHYNTFCGVNAPAIERWTVAAIAIYYILFSAPASIEQMQVYFGQGWLSLRQQLRWRGTEDVPKDMMRDACTGILEGVGNPSTAQRVMALVDIVMNTLYSSVIALLTLYLVYNGTSPIDMTKYVVFIHFLFQLDEKFLMEDRHMIRAGIILTILAKQEAAKLDHTQHLAPRCGMRISSNLVAIAVHLLSVLCSVVAIVTPFVFVGYLFAAPVCL